MSARTPGPLPEPSPEDPASEIFGELRGLKTVWYGKRDPSLPPKPGTDGAAASPAAPEAPRTVPPQPPLAQEPLDAPPAAPPRQADRKIVTLEPQTLEVWSQLTLQHRHWLGMDPNFNSLTNEALRAIARLLLREPILKLARRVAIEEGLTREADIHAAVRRQLRQRLEVLLGMGQPGQVDR